ncbi:MAG TPA: hypothetical protein VGP80_15480 [Gemmatimonadales bacterium]|jgi:hypothetical protein|nr:hypothetical protein [Gemmatimonadales bacterium]
MRSTHFGLGVLAAATAIAVACVDSRQPTATDQPALATTDAACQFGVMNDLIRGYFAVIDRAPAKSLVAQMQQFFVGGDFLRATDKGFDVLALIESARNGHRQIGTPQAGSALANALLACMTVGSPALPIDFSGPLGPGGFGVRGGTTDPAAPVLSSDGLSGVGLQESTWPAVFGKRVLLFGTPNPAATFQEILVGSPYAWSSLPPSPIINAGAVIGFCITNPGRYRIEESHTATPHSILFLRDASSFLACSAPAPIGTNALGPVGGSATGFSDFGVVDAQSINLSYLSQPSTVQAGQVITPSVRVLAKGNGGTPLPEVSSTLTLVRITGTGNLSGTLTNVTGSSGIETYDDLRVSSPGTYAIVVTASLSGFGTVQLQSNSFVVTP